MEDLEMDLLIMEDQEMDHFIMDDPQEKDPTLKANLLKYPGVIKDR